MSSHCLLNYLFVCVFINVHTKFILVAFNVLAPRQIDLLAHKNRTLAGARQQDIVWLWSIFCHRDRKQQLNVVVFANIGFRLRL